MGRAGRLSPKSGEFGVARNANDAEGPGVFRQIESEMLIQRVFVLFEEALHKRLIHYRYRLGVFVVALA